MLWMTWSCHHAGTIYLHLHKLAQAATKDSDALDVETIGDLVDTVLRPLDDLFRPGVTMLDFGDRVVFGTLQLNITMQ